MSEEIKIIDGAVTANKLASGSVTTNKLGTNSVGNAAINNSASFTMGALTVDNIALDGNTLAVGSGNLTVDVAGDIDLDSDSGIVKLSDGGTEYARFFRNVTDSDLVIRSIVQDEDIFFQGNDGGTFFNALTLDMSDAGAATFNNTITATGDITAFSDARLKENVSTIENALDKVDNLRGVNYNMKDSDDAKIGVIAQEVEEILPQVVHTSDDEMQTKSVDYGKLCAVLIEAVKELKKEVEELKGK